MNIYRISQTLNNSYDTYDSAVVYAATENEARSIHPSDSWDYSRGEWVEKYQVDLVKVDYIGSTTEEVDPGVILASFNAG